MLEHFLKQVMDAPTLSVSAEKILEILSRSEWILFTMRPLMSSLQRPWIKTIEAIDTITRRQEKRSHMELERQLASVQESQRQDQENFRKLQEIMPTTRQGANVVMTLEAVQAMIDQTLLKNNTTDDGSQNSVFHISGCAVENQVKFATCTLLGAALTWWNGHVRTLGYDTAYAMTWEILKKKLTDKYCPKGETKKLENKLWNLKVKGFDVGGYNQRFQELALMCTNFISNETEKVDKYISGLPDNIHGNVMSARPKTLDDAIELANDLMDLKLRTYAKRQAENKRNLDNNNQAQQQLLKKQNVVQAYAVGTGEKKPYRGSKPLCSKCNYHHDGECAPKSDFPVLKNQGTEARGRVYALGGGETNQDLDNAGDDINA
uniref:Reverse transcriptase domain-containing protein n=1 Tax=Tanacetum cinerariifolium TaxID=118510 RepID=A0A6L2M3V6_TANCI|nr:reverse transcriptase domain-containing protein [Tanacetum cinerariifolium]